MPTRSPRSRSPWSRPGSSNWASSSSDRRRKRLPRSSRRRSRCGGRSSRRPASLPPNRPASRERAETMHSRSLDRRRFVTLGAAALFAPAAIGRAQAQAWPNRFVRLIVPLAPGGPTDVAARLVAEPLTKAWGHQVVIENKPGGGTNLASDLVAKSAPDGHTILYATSSLSVAPSLYRTLSYDPVADLAPVSLLFSFPFYMFVPNSSPAKTVQEFIAHVKANPGKVTMASPGTGTTAHVRAEQF